MKQFLLVSALIALAGPALAGDAAKGESEFKKCKSCHSIVKPDGTEVVKGGKVGPNLFGVIGRAVGGTEFAYSPGMKALAASGKTWDEASLTAYVADPSKWLQEASGDAAAKSKMSFRLASGGADIAAYLAMVQ